MKKYKVIVWGLGSVGRYAVIMIQSKKSLELVCAIDVDPKKVGKDAGEIFGFDKANVIVSDDIDEVLARSRLSANLSPNIGIVDNILKGKCQCKKYKLCMLMYQIQNYP